MGGKNQLKIVRVEERNSVLIQELVDVWESSVQATHLFLSPDEIHHIKQYVPQALTDVPILMVAENKEGKPIGFMGVADQTLEMLFISNEYRGKGLGKQFIQYAIENYAINKLTVNEQNPLAKGFYEYMGFEVYKRRALDEIHIPYYI